MVVHFIHLMDRPSTDGKWALLIAIGVQRMQSPSMASNLHPRFGK